MSIRHEDNTLQSTHRAVPFWNMGLSFSRLCWFFSTYLVQMVVAIGLSIILGSILVVLNGESPLRVYTSLLREGFFTPLGLMIGIQRATPYIITAAAAALAFKGGAINMGLEGQFTVGVSVAGIAACLLPEMPALLRIALIFLICGAGGAAAAFVPAIFKRMSGVSEVITGMIANLMIPYLMSSIIYAVPAFRQAQGAASEGIPASAWLPQFSELTNGSLGEGTKANLGLLAAILIVAILAFCMQRTRLGYEIRITRAGFSFAEFAGIPAGRMFFITMMLSGAIAAMGGATEVLGVWRKASLGTLAVADKGLVLALAGGNTFLGSAVAAFLYGGLESGAMNAAWMTNTPKPLIDILVQILFLLAATPSMFRFFSDGKLSAENLGGRFLVKS